MTGDKERCLENGMDGYITIAPFESGERRSIALLAHALDASGRKTEAIPYYRRMLQMDPENAVTMNNIAFLIGETGGNLDEALDLAQRALAKAPLQANFADTLAWIYLKKGQVHVAVEMFHKVSQKYPDNATFRQHLALAQARAKH